jgi:hypothetical protein
MQLSISAFNVKFSENRAVRGFRWDVLLNAFYNNVFIYCHKIRLDLLCSKFLVNN